MALRAEKMSQKLKALAALAEDKILSLILSTLESNSKTVLEDLMFSSGLHRQQPHISYIYIHADKHVRIKIKINPPKRCAEEMAQQ